MPVYRLRYRTAATTGQSAGAWSTSVERFFETPLASYRHTFDGLTNGVRYEFAVGRVDNTGRVDSWSSIPSGTPAGNTGTYNSLGTFEVNGTDVKTIERTSTNTVLTLKANWQYVTIDYTVTGNASKHGVTKTTGFNLPGGYTTNAVIVSNSPTQVTIALDSSVQVVISIKGNGASIATYTLLAIG